MALFSASSPTRGDSGKFRQRRRPGMQHDGQHQYGAYRFELLSMESTTPVVRTRYHVRISTDRNLRIGYLRDFVTPRAAIAAAEEWVAERERLAKKGV